MQDTDFRLTVLGARGSVPVSGREFVTFGGNTSCYLAEAGEDTVILDAGSGLVKAPADFPNPPIIVLSHLHLDHVLGLGMYPRLARPGCKTGIAVPTWFGERPGKILDALYAPPFWPIRMSGYEGEIEFLPLDLPLRMKNVQVEILRGNHPGGCAVIKLSYDHRSLVYISDYEFDPVTFPALCHFCMGATLLLFDAQYTREQCAQKKGFGHSCAERGIQLMEVCKAEQLLLVHHDPKCTDEMLLQREAAIGMKNVRYAREGDVIAL